MARVNTDILGISELKWTRMGEFNSGDHWIYCGQESLRRNGVALIVNKTVWNMVLGCNLKNDRMISVCFQDKPFNITAIQVYAPTTDIEETEVEWFCEDEKDLLELKKRCPFHHGGLECKSSKSRDTWNNSQVWPCSPKWSRAKDNRVLPREHTGHSKNPFPTTRDNSTQGHQQMANTKIILIIFFAAEDGEALYSQQKQDWELTVAQIITPYCQIQT